MMRSSNCTTQSPVKSGAKCKLVGGGIHGFPIQPPSMLSAEASSMAEIISILLPYLGVGVILKEPKNSTTTRKTRMETSLEGTNGSIESILTGFP